MPISIEVCLCILLCAASTLDQERCFAEINRSLRDKESAPDKGRKAKKISASNEADIPEQ